MTDEQIILAYSAYISESPGDPRFARLGDLYLKNGDLRKALEVLTAGIGANPTYVTGQQVLAKVLIKAGYLKEARERFEIVLRIDPGNVMAMWQIAKIDFKQGNTQEGIDRLRSLLALDPFDEKAKRELRNLNVELPEHATPSAPEVVEPEVSSTIETHVDLPVEIEPTPQPRPPTGSEISSVENELEELLKMDLSEMEDGTKSALFEEDKFLVSENIFEPGMEAGKAEEIEGIESKKEFEAPDVEKATRIAEESLESAVFSIEESMPAFDLDTSQAALEEKIETAPTAPVQPEIDVSITDSLDIGSELPAFDTGVEPVVKIAPPPVEEESHERHVEQIEETLSLDGSENSDEIFDFSPPEKSDKIKVSEPAHSEREVVKKDTGVEDKALDLTPPTEKPPQKEPEESDLDEVEDLGDFDFTPPSRKPAAKQVLKVADAMTDALKQIEVQEEADIEEIAEEPEKSESDKSSDENIPALSMEGPTDEQEPKDENITDVGGYEFTESHDEAALASSSDKEVFQFRQKFQPIDETLEVEGFVGKNEFSPPSERSGGPEFNEIEFVDELDGFVPHKPEDKADIEEVVDDDSEQSSPAEGESSEEDETDAMFTVTMAEIYAGQGEIKKAISVYNSILKKTVDSNEIDRIEKRIEHLSKLMGTGLNADSS